MSNQEQQKQPNQYEQIRNSQLKNRQDTDISQHNKLMLLLSLSLITGIIAIVSFFFLLKTKRSVMDTLKPLPQQEVQESTPSENETTKTFDPEMEVFELDKLNLESIEDDYSSSVLENN